MRIAAAVHTYNRSHYLRATLDAVLAQSRPPDTIVLVDDGSTDDTARVVAPYGSRVAYHHIDNAGAGWSRHVSIERSDAEWVACCDDDDLWLPDHLKTIEQVIQCVPDADVVFSNFRTFGESGESAGTKFDDAPEGWWASATTGDDVKVFRPGAYGPFLSFNPVFPSCMAVRKAFYESVGGTNRAYSRQQGEDAELTRRLVLDGRVVCSMRDTVRIRKHGQNLSGNISRNMLGKARMLRDHLNAGLVPDALVTDTRLAIAASAVEAFRLAYWYQDGVTMRVAFAEARGQGLTATDYLRYAVGRVKFRG